MFLLDSNVVIYAADPAYPAATRFVEAHVTAVSSLSLVEALGYHKLTEQQKSYFEDYFSNTTVLPVTPAVIDRAITLRQFRKMSLGDALIAATALTTGRTLVTHNTKDFDWIGGLRLLDPLAGPSANGAV